MKKHHTYEIYFRGKLIEEVSATNKENALYFYWLDAEKKKDFTAKVKAEPENEKGRTSTLIPTNKPKNYLSDDENFYEQDGAKSNAYRKYILGL